MFAKAYDIVKDFTKPVIVSTRLFNGQVDSSVASYIVLNKEGWILTAAHVFDSYINFQKHKKEVEEYKEKVKVIESDTRVYKGKKNKSIEKIPCNQKWITNILFSWSVEGINSFQVTVNREIDLAVAKLEPFDTHNVRHSPVFKDPKGISIGTSLCKLGFPFYKVKTEFDELKGVFRFDMASGIPRFPIEGMYTRNILAGKTQDGKYEKKFLETSSPGLRGQSGGPIFDTEGVVWAIQSHTRHFPLGFSPLVKKGGKEVEENQFLNVGVGVHPEVILAFLADNEIKFSLSE